MSARILDGQALARQIRDELRPRVSAFTEKLGRPPGLGIVLVGEHPSSEVYVRSKLRAASEIGIRADLERLPASATLGDALAVVERLNRSDVHDGVLVQSPLPRGMGAGAEQTVFDTIDPAKDVDGFTPVNVGRLVQKRATLTACTPLGVLELLTRSGIPIAGSCAVVIGRSDIVGKPTAMLLMHRDATVTVCHSKTRGLPDVCARADILVAALGRPAFVTRAFVKPGATIIDVGITRVSDRAVIETLYGPGDPRRTDFARRGSLLVGDVHPEVGEVAGALSPVPGGVGPLTVAMLLSNTVRAAEARASA
jgi:methylenetetrahydrofolate dehydrogenase (NADP+) / methenyltetrahydrofolate cyclohydrolase